MDSLAPPSSRLRLVRRVLDVLVAAAALAVLLPVLVGVGAAVRMSSPGPALFRQVRLGEGGRPFVLLKLRSMTTSASGPEVTSADDARVTPLGRWLRATSVDELPQLWNVLRGQMTLVGPRPETPALAVRYPAGSRWVLEHRPGLTGPAQLQLRDDAALDPDAQDPELDYLERLVPERTALDAQYLADPTVRRTVAVLIRTAGAVVRGRPRPRITHLTEASRGLAT